MSIKLRFAQPEDMRSVLDMIIELAVFEKEPDAVEVTVEELINDGFGKDPVFKVIVAEIEEKIVGMALFYQRYSTWKGRAIHLEDLIVKEEYRGKGVGSALYRELLQYAFDQKFKRVAWEVLDWNKVAIDFYESTGARILEDWKVVHMDQNGLKQFVGKLKNKEF